MLAHVSCNMSIGQYLTNDCIFVRATTLTYLAPSFKGSEKLLAQKIDKLILKTHVQWKDTTEL